ncbi:MAG: hypothetical protein ACLUO4_08205 [Christensenellales bacterium]
MNKRLYPDRRQLNRILSAWMLISSVFLYVLWMPIPGARYIGWIGFAGVWLVALIVAYKKRKKFYAYYCSEKGFERIDLFGNRMKLIKWEDVAQIAMLKSVDYLYVSEVKRSWDQIRLYFSRMPEEDTMLIPLNGQVVAEAMRRLPEEKWIGLQKMPDRKGA